MLSEFTDTEDMVAMVVGVLKVWEMMVLLASYNYYNGGERKMKILHNNSSALVSIHKDEKRKRLGTQVLVVPVHSAKKKASKLLHPMRNKHGDWSVSPPCETAIGVFTHNRGRERIDIAFDFLLLSLYHAIMLFLPIY